MAHQGWALIERRRGWGSSRGSEAAPLRAAARRAGAGLPLTLSLPALLATTHTAIGFHCGARSGWKPRLSGSGRVFSTVGVPKQDVGGNAPPQL
ncbi:hypothetical protein JZ751_005051 [Albula glossodonta]|uniref:Uncharacterized protein n=1 Tax=Albula glossodonta TaxID=121402 RepID=A0A8T2P4N8_9TELE|nr:hypothetical protein JZ751_005051 [Albula glossodonta]